MQAGASSVPSTADMAHNRSNGEPRNALDSDEESGVTPVAAVPQLSSLSKRGSKGKEDGVKPNDGAVIDLQGKDGILSLL